MNGAWRYRLYLPDAEANYVFGAARCLVAAVSAMQAALRMLYVRFQKERLPVMAEAEIEVSREMVRVAPILAKVFTSA